MTGGDPLANGDAGGALAAADLGGDRVDVLRNYAFLADGERGAVVDPGGSIEWLCFPGWGDDPIFDRLLGGRGHYTVAPIGRYVWGSQYEEGTLVWRNRWIVGAGIVECFDAFAFPGQADRAVLVRRVVAVDGPAEVAVELDLGQRYDLRQATPSGPAPGPAGDQIWVARSGDVELRWQVPAAVHVEDHGLAAALQLRPGQHADLVLELQLGRMGDDPPIAGEVLASTRSRWRQLTSAIHGPMALRDSRHAVAVMRGMTTAGGAMVAAATMSLPERADMGRDYDYRYAWIRDQCYAGMAAGRAGEGAEVLLDDAVRFVHQRLLDDGPDLHPAYCPYGKPVPDQHPMPLAGYPGSPDVMAGNRAGHQFQLDLFGEALLLFAVAAADDRMHGDAWAAAEVAATAIEQRWTEPDSGIWEVRPRRYTHSRLACVAGLRALAAHAPKGPRTNRWLSLADAIGAGVAASCVHASGRWQQADDDERCDASLLLAGLRGAVAADDPRTRATLAAVRRDLVVDGYVYRYQVDRAPLGQAEGAFLLCGFWLALACHQAGDHVAAARFFERNRSACGPAGLFAEEYDVHQRQLRGNFPQAFVHALLLEAACTLHEEVDAA